MLATDGSWHIGPQTEPFLCPRAETTRPIRRRRPAPRTHGRNQSLLHIQYFELATEADTDAYLAQFTDDAVVEDEGKAQHGIAEIRAWHAEILRVQYDVKRVDRHENTAQAMVEISGTFAGSPVTLRFQFECTADGRIAVLRIHP